MAGTDQLSAFFDELVRKAAPDSGENVSGSTQTPRATELSVPEVWPSGNSPHGPPRPAWGIGSEGSVSDPVRSSVCASEISTLPPERVKDSYILNLTEKLPDSRSFQVRYPGARSAEPQDSKLDAVPTRFLPYGTSEPSKSPGTGLFSDSQYLDTSRVAELDALKDSGIVTPQLIQQKLEENQQMLFAVHEKLKSGRCADTTAFFEKLQQNLMFLALIADQPTNSPERLPGNVADTGRTSVAKTDFWTSQETHRLHHALRIPVLDLEQLSIAVGTKSPDQVLGYLQQCADRWALRRTGPS